jgi:hypothetical protein
MNKHLVVRVNSAAPEEWQRLHVYSPVGDASIDFSGWVASQLPGDGEFLVRVEINVQVLDGHSNQSEEVMRIIDPAGLLDEAA